MRILVTPMDWGLGHASRCVPVIRALIDQRAEVILATAGPALALLRRYFPDLPAERLPAYDIRYPSENMTWNMLKQAPKLLRTIRRESQAVRTLARRYAIHAVLSDNRFGCRTPFTHNVFITHQLAIRTRGRGSGFLANTVNRHLIQRFDECWIPDVPGEGSLSGDLSRASLSIPVHHTGWLSPQHSLTTRLRYFCVAVLSGPEPQRSRLETILRPQLRTLNRPCLLIRGKVEEAPVRTEGPLTIVPYLHGESLNEAMASAQVIVARSGYSTLMDLAVLGKKAILIPTPGQTEQIYLARRLAAQNRCVVQEQRQVDIAGALSRLNQIEPLTGDYNEVLLQQRVKALLKTIHNQSTEW